VVFFILNFEGAFQEMDSWVTLKIFFISLKVVEHLRLTPFLSFLLNFNLLIHDAPSDRGGGV